MSQPRSGSIRLNRRAMGWQWGAVLAAGMVAGCAPALDWREVRPGDSGLALLFPCKPRTQQRTVTIDARAVTLSLHACRAASMNFGVAHADVVDPGRVAPALEAMRVGWIQAAQAELVGSAPQQVPGMTPQPGALRVRLRIERPDSHTTDAVAAFFAKGTRVFQVTIHGAPLDAETVDVFMSSLNLAVQPR